jgi:hypothetical protein
VVAGGHGHRGPDDYTLAIPAFLAIVLMPFVAYFGIDWVEQLTGVK